MHTPYTSGLNIRIIGSFKKHDTRLAFEQLRARYFIRLFQLTIFSQPYSPSVTKVRGLKELQ